MKDNDARRHADQTQDPFGYENWSKGEGTRKIAVKCVPTNMVWRNLNAQNYGKPPWRYWSKLEIAEFWQ